MAIIAKEPTGGEFTPHPAGQYQCVAVDVADLGEMPNKFQEGRLVHKVRLYWMSHEKMEDGRPFLIAKMYTLSLHEKSTLRHDLESWRGKPFTPQELAGFDLEKLIGAPAYLQIQHRTTENGKTFANVVGIMKAIPALEIPDIPSDFIRYKDRPDNSPEDRVGDPPAPTDSDHVVDDDIPF